MAPAWDRGVLERTSSEIFPETTLELLPFLSGIRTPRVEIFVPALHVFFILSQTITLLAPEAKKDKVCLFSFLIVVESPVKPFGLSPAN